jgi:L-iditol 2-dehydrogenase
VKVASVGVCASDVHYYEHGRIGSFVVEEPLILGHESAGEVIEVGAEVTTLSPGDRVSMEPGVPCAECAYCRSGRYNLCPDVVFMATPPVHGAFCEYIAHPAAYCYKIPDSMTFDEAAMMEPLSVGLFSVERSDAQSGQRVAVLGAGPIGLAVLLALTAQGVTNVTLFDILDSRVAKAMELGAAAAVNVARVALETDYANRFDIVIETAGAESATTATTRIATPGATIVLVGHVATDVVAIDTNELIIKQLDVVGSFRYAHTYARGIELVAAGKIDVAKFISRHFTLDEAEAALRFARDAKDQCIKAVVTP